MAFHWAENVNTASFTPREYQVELIDTARDRNIIMCLSQNSSRDFIALKVIQEHANQLRGDAVHSRKKSVYMVDDTRIDQVASMLKCLTDLDVSSVKDINEWHDLPTTFQVLVTTAYNITKAFLTNIVDFNLFNILIIENCHNVVKDGHDVQQLMNFIKTNHACTKTRIIGITGPLYSSNCFGGVLAATVHNIQKSMMCEVETASDIVSSLRYSVQPTQLLIECDEGNSNDLDTEIRRQVGQVKAFLEDHRFAPDEMYDDEEYLEELRAMPDPSLKPLKLLDEFIEILDEFGPWCADKAALNTLLDLQKEKLKIKYERHYLLLSIVETLLIKIRATCDYAFNQYSDIERITKFSTPKVLRLISIIKSFKPDKTLSLLEDNIKAINECNFTSLSEKLSQTCEEITNESNDEVEKLKNDIKNFCLTNNGRQEKTSIDCDSIGFKDSGQGSSANSVSMERSSSTDTISNSPKGKKPKKFENQNSRKHRMSKRNANSGHRGAPRINYYQLDPDALCGLILVPNKLIAKILFALICELTHCDSDCFFINVQFTAEKSADPVSEPKEAEQENKMQEDVLRRFRMHECNLLIGTAILEHGIDLPRCNLVVHWDIPSSFGSFAHSKGRARASSAVHAFLVTKSVTNVAISRLAEYCEVEKMLLSNCQNMEPPATDEEFADKFTECIKPYRPLPHVENSSSVNLLTAIALVNRYCAKLPSDTFTRLTPLWRLYQLKRNGIKLYQCIVRLPINSPLKKDIIGIPMPSQILARRIAAFQTCVELHKCGELDDSLQPLGKECLKVQKELHLLDFQEEEVSVDYIPRPGTTKRRQYYFKKIAEALCDSEPTVDEPCNFYGLKMKLTCPLPEEHNTRGRQLYDPDDSPNGFGLLTRKVLPKIGNFSIFTRSGEVSVSLQLITPGVTITRAKIDLIHTFVNYCFTKVLKLQKLFMVFEPHTAKYSYYVVPTITENGVISIDWNFLEIIHREELHKKEDLNFEQCQKDKFSSEKFKDAVVMPWYRNQDTPQYFYVAEICNDLNPLSPFPGPNFKCFKDYYFAKYKITVKNLTQPLLDVDHTSGRLNFLTPRYVNRKGVALPTSSEETKRAKREDLSNKQILIPELCTVHPFPGALWRAAVCLPCILYRINGLLVADQIRAEVARDIGLGTKHLAEGLEWPKLDFGWSLAEVYSKTKNKATNNSNNNTPVVNEKRHKSEILEEVDHKKKLHDVQESICNQDIISSEENELEIGLWTNDMASSNDKDDNSNLQKVVRYNSPTQWLNKNSCGDCEIYSDSDCDGSLDNLSMDNQSEDSLNDPDGFHIKYEDDNQAEAIETNPATTCLQTFMSQYNDNVDLDWGISEIDSQEEFKFSEQYKERLEQIKKDIVNDGVLVRYNAEIPPRRNSMNCFAPRSSEGSSPLCDLIPYHPLTLTENNMSIDSIIAINDTFIETYGNDDKTLVSAADYYEGINMVTVFESIKNNMNKRDIESQEIDLKISFDHQPDLAYHPGPSPSIILQALTMSNANDGINLERLETIGDSYLKYAITTYLYCIYDNIHEGKLSHLRSLQVSNLHLYRLGFKKNLGESMIATKFEPHDNWLPPCFLVPTNIEEAIDQAKESGLAVNIPTASNGNKKKNNTSEDPDSEIPYNIITEHSIPDKSIADCVEALIGAYLIECGPRGALLFMSWLGIKVLPQYEFNCTAEEAQKVLDDVDRPAGFLKPYCRNNQWIQPYYGSLEVPPSPLVREIKYADECMEYLLTGYDALEEHLGYKFKDRSYLLQAMTHASYSSNRLTDCYQRLEFLGDAVLDYLITRHLYDSPLQHSPGALTDLRSALVNNIIFASLAVRNHFHRYFLHRSPGLHDVISRFVAMQEANSHIITEEYFLVADDEYEAAEDVEIPKALGDLFESVAGAIFLDSGMSLDAVWRVYYNMMKSELTQFGNHVPKSPIRELLEMEPETAKFGKPEKLANGRKVRVTVDVFGKGTFKGIGRNYRIAKCTAAKCALRNLKMHNKLSSLAK